MHTPDWVSLLQNEGVDYETYGKNTSKGWVSVKCPFCTDDPSRHMGIHLSSGSWSCWRDISHRGRSAENLLIALLGVSKGTATALIEQYPSSPSIFLSDPSPVKQRHGAEFKPVLPAECRHIVVGSLTHKFWQYLYDRDFDDPDSLIDDYNLQACLVGKWKGRLIIPTYDMRGLVGWQGRDIKNVADIPKYLTSSDRIKNTLFNLKNIYNGGESLYICEGPFDALKIDFYAKRYGIRATCTYGVNMTMNQIGKLIELQSRFKRFILLFDTDSSGVAAGFTLSNYIPVKFGNLPGGVHDPGDLTKQQVLAMTEYED